MKIDRSPWGKPHSVTEIMDGFWKVTTASHGGVKLSAEMNRKIPKEFRAAGGWYEEDEAVSIADYFLRDILPASYLTPKRLECGIRTLKSSYRKEWEAMS